MAINFAPGPVQDPFAAELLAEQKQRRAIVRQLMGNTGGSGPVHSVGEGLAKVGASMMSGLIARQMEEEDRARAAAGDAALISGLPAALAGSPTAESAGGGSAPPRDAVVQRLFRQGDDPNAPAPAFASRGELPSMTTPPEMGLDPNASAFSMNPDGSPAYVPFGGAAPRDVPVRAKLALGLSTPNELDRLMPRLSNLGGDPSLRTASAAPVSAKPGEVAAAVHEELVKGGLSPIATAGVLGNWMEESTMNPGAFNKGEGAGGMGQWRLERLDGLKQFAASQEADWADPRVQARYFLHEVQQPGFQGVYAALMNAKTPAEAAAAVIGYEKPGGWKPGAGYGDPSGVPSYRDRIGHAENFYRQLAGAGGGRVQTASLNPAVQLPGATVTDAAQKGDPAPQANPQAPVPPMQVAQAGGAPAPAPMAPQGGLQPAPPPTNLPQPPRVPTMHELMPDYEARRAQAIQLMQSNDPAMKMQGRMLMQQLWQQFQANRKAVTEAQREAEKLGYNAKVDLYKQDREFAKQRQMEEFRDSRQRINVPQGGTVVDRDGKVIFSAPEKPTLHNVPPGATVLGADGKPIFTAPDPNAAKEADTRTFETERKLREEFSGQVKNYVTVRDAFGRVRASVEHRIAEPNAADPSADKALMFGYMKMLDPGSVVREGDYATAQNTTSVPERIRNLYNKALNGEFLSDQQRADMVKASDRLYRQARKDAEAVAKRYERLSGSYGVTPGRVVELPEALTIPELPVHGAAPDQSGAGATPAPTGLPEGYTPQRALDEARAAIAAGKDRNAVIQRLRSMGIEPEGL